MTDTISHIFLTDGRMITSEDDKESVISDWEDAYIADPPKLVIRLKNPLSDEAQAVTTVVNALQVTSIEYELPDES